MKKILSILSIVTLSSTSIGTTLATNTNNKTQINNNISNHAYQVEYIKSPVPTKSFLTTSGDWNTYRWEWAYTTINLGKLKPNQIMGIGSLNNDSYTEHKVESYGYHKIDKTAGIHHGPNFRNYFYQGKVTPNWTYREAVSGANLNFNSYTTWGLAHHWAEGTIKFLWHHNADSELLIDIVGTLYVAAYASGVKGVASIKLGSWFTIYYRN